MGSLYSAHVRRLGLGGCNVIAGCSVSLVPGDNRNSKGLLSYLRNFFSSKCCIRLVRHTRVTFSKQHSVVHARTRHPDETAWPSGPESIRRHASPRNRSRRWCLRRRLVAGRIRKTLLHLDVRLRDRRLYVRRGPLGRERKINESKTTISDDELKLRLREIALNEAKRLRL